MLLKKSKSKKVSNNVRNESAKSKKNDFELKNLVSIYFNGNCDSK